MLEISRKYIHKSWLFKIPRTDQHREGIPRPGGRILRKEALAGEAEGIGGGEAVGVEGLQEL